MYSALSVLTFLESCQTRGERAVLVTLSDVMGSSARSAGSHMAVAADGTAAGSFSGGCVEAAVVAEALDVLAANVPRKVRFGAGSPYIDIRLPCGGGIDLIFTPDPDPAEVIRACDMLRAREPVSIGMTVSGEFQVGRPSGPEPTLWHGDRFVVRHDPALNIVVLGHGTEPGAMLRIAKAYGAQCLLLSPDPACLSEASEQDVPAVHIRTRGRSGLLDLDAYSAVIFLFHDHDWEGDLLLEALEQNCFFVGAMGSRRTHAARLADLVERGATPEMCERVKGPVGLLPAMRDPASLAVSIMAQILSVYEKQRLHSARPAPMQAAE